MDMRHRALEFIPSPRQVDFANNIFRMFRGEHVALAEHICVSILAAIASVENNELTEYEKPGWEVTVRRVGLPEHVDYAPYQMFDFPL